MLYASLRKRKYTNNEIKTDIMIIMIIIVIFIMIVIIKMIRLVWQ